jgi:hypothetical protein
MEVVGETFGAENANKTFTDSPPLRSYDFHVGLSYYYYYYCYPSQNQNLMYQAFVQSILLHGAETWTLNTQQANKLLATEMDFWRFARKSMKEQARNTTIREVMEVG